MRARVSSYVGLGWQAGVLAAALIVPLLLPRIGWRGMFALGVLPALLCLYLRRGIAEEPPLFLARRGQTSFAERLRLLVKDAATAKASLGVFILCSVQNFGYYGIMIWLPSYLSSRFGYSLTQSALWTAVTVLGMACGIWVFGQLADRFGRKPIFLAYQLGAAIRCSSLHSSRTRRRCSLAVPSWGSSSTACWAATGR